jgi:hypothetical protein
MPRLKCLQAVAAIFYALGYDTRAVPVFECLIFLTVKAFVDRRHRAIVDDAAHLWRHGLRRLPICDNRLFAFREVKGLLTSATTSALHGMVFARHFAVSIRLMMCGWRHTAAEISCRFCQGGNFLTRKASIKV